MWTIYCYPAARPLWVCTKHCLYKVSNILLSCSTTLLSMYKTLSLQGEPIYCCPVVRPLWVCTKHCLYKGNSILLSCSTTFVMMYKILSLQCEQYIVILQHDICEHVQNIVSTRWTIFCCPVVRPLWVCTKHCLNKMNNILLSCCTSICEYVQNIDSAMLTIYCYHVARPFWVCTKHCLYKVNNTMLSCSTSFVTMYKSLSLQDEQLFVIR